MLDSSNVDTPAITEAALPPLLAKSASVVEASVTEEKGVAVTTNAMRYSLLQTEEQLGHV